MLMVTPFSASTAHDLDHSGASAPPVGAQIQRNGIGPDPDGDGNPATNAYAFAHIGDPIRAAADPIYSVITFEPPPGEHGAPILNAYAKKFGVSFGHGLTHQICKGQRYHRYDSLCTYIAPPSGDYAAAYRDDFLRPLEVSFKKPICAVSVAVYPTGGGEDEVFELTIQGFDQTGTALEKTTARFAWTQNTFRWRVMKAVHFSQHNAFHLKISMQSLSEPNRNIRFLIDDLAFATQGCNAGS